MDLALRSLSSGSRNDRDDMTMAITREKELKKWRRDWKVNLIERSNPEWVDLYPALASWA